MKYKIRCLKCGKIYSGNEYVIKCQNGCDSLLRTEYTKKKLEIKDYPGWWKYIDWLPVKTVNKRLLKRSGSYQVYLSSGLARYLGLRHLIICKNIYQLGIHGMMTGTFKDIEAELALLRIQQTKEKGKPIVVSSDGNIAISFCYYSNVLKYPVILVVTEEARQKRIWSFNKTNPYVILISVCGNSDYSDAITLANKIGEDNDFVLEGGARNIARRDGVGTILLDATLFLGRLPDCYFQALGSGPGAIGVYEAALRLVRDGRYGKKLPKIYASQNYPFIPMAEAWQRRAREIDSCYQEESAKRIISQVYASILTNRYPLYSIKGGVFDILKDTSGGVFSVTNREAKKAQVLFRQVEGYDIEPAAAITVASLIKAVKNGAVKRNEVILLNITGGGRGKIRRKRFKVRASISVKKDDDVQGIIKRIKKIWGIR